jgi:hypothetical protein
MRRGAGGLARRRVLPATVLATMLVAGCGRERAGPADAAAQDSVRAVPQWVFEPGVRFGPLDATASESDLVAAYGAAAVRAAEVPLGEGETAPGTEVFAGDSLRRFLVTWVDTLERRGPDRVELAGDTTLWRSGAGVTLGLPLARLEQINGGPFTLLGFGWDYGGTVSSWDGGTLAPWEGQAFVSLAPSAAAYGDSAYQSVLGDRPFASSTPAMQALAPRVRRIVVRLQ